MYFQVEVSPKLSGDWFSLQGFIFNLESIAAICVISSNS